MNKAPLRSTQFKVEFWTDASGKSRRHRARCYNTCEGMIRAGARWEARGRDYWCRYWNGLNTWLSSTRRSATDPQPKVRPRGKKAKTEIFSIFGVCEAAAAEIMIEAGKLTRIPKEQIPESVAYNVVDGKRIEARFAVVVPSEHKGAFEELCKELRA